MASLLLLGHDAKEERTATVTIRVLWLESDLCWVRILLHLHVNSSRAITNAKISASSHLYQSQTPSPSDTFSATTAHKCVIFLWVLTRYACFPPDLIFLINLSLFGSRGGCVDESLAHCRTLSEHFWVQYLAQGHLGHVL